MALATTGAINNRKEEEIRVSRLAIQSLGGRVRTNFFGVQGTL